MILRRAFALAILSSAACTAAEEPPPAEPQATLSPADSDAAFKAAGFTKKKDAWIACENPESDSSYRGVIDNIADRNADGLPEAVIYEGGTFCYGFAGQGYFVVSKQADGGWKLMDSGQGFATFLETKGKDGWPDIEVGGPGFCFPVLRWDGAAYVFNREEYEGKPCE